MFCQKCGVENKDGTKFCTSCGEKFVDGAVQPVQIPAAATQKHGILYWIALIIGILIVLYFLGMMIMYAFVYGTPG